MGQCSRRISIVSFWFLWLDADGKPMLNSAPSPIAVSYNNYGQRTSKKIEIPNERVGVITGKSGETIKFLQNQSGAKIQVTPDVDADPHAPTRMVELMGTAEHIAKAEQLIKEALAEVMLNLTVFICLISALYSGVLAAFVISMKLPQILIIVSNQRL